MGVSWTEPISRSNADRRMVAWSDWVGGTVVGFEKVPWGHLGPWGSEIVKLSPGEYVSWGVTLSSTFDSSDAFSEAVASSAPGWIELHEGAERW
jgi:hypothetical protein